MNETLFSELANLASRASFVGVTYTSKKSGEKARWVLRVNTDYCSFLEKNILEAEIRLTEIDQNSVEAAALVELKAAWEKSLQYHKQGLENPDYTKAGMYTRLGNGLKLFKDNTLELQGVKHTYVVIIPGEHKKVNHRTPITAEKARLQKTFPQWVTLAIDSDSIHSVRLNGEEVDLETE